MYTKKKFGYEYRGSCLVDSTHGLVFTTKMFSPLDITMVKEIKLSNTISSYILLLLPWHSRSYISFRLHSEKSEFPPKKEL